ncbi:MAG: ATP-binding protein [Candidatus Aminicenantes bacterium]|nr:ATP-binding protein [Candidatus Aminicenantes bacterium]
MTCDCGFTQNFEIQGGNFSRAGVISSKIKEILQELGINNSIIRRTAIAAYEAEMNVVIHADRGEVTMNLNPGGIQLIFKDEGQGIRDIELAMQEGYSTATDEMREMGFGAGMGLPNIKKNADRFEVSSIPGRGTTLDMFFNFNGQT